MSSNSSQPWLHQHGRQVQQFGTGPPAPPPVGQRHMIVDLHVRCRQEGVQIFRHSRSWAPSPRYHAAFKESII